MSLNQNKGWFFGIVAFVALFTGSSFFIADAADDQTGMMQFSNLSDSDIDAIVAVKAEMDSAKIKTN